MFPDLSSIYIMWPRILSVSPGAVTTTRRSSILFLTFVVTCLLLFTSWRLYSPTTPIQRWMCAGGALGAIHPDALAALDSVPVDGPHIPALVDVIEHTADCFDRYRLQGPYKEHFGERGQRAVALRKWIELADRLPASSPSRRRIEGAIERAAVSIFPYLKDPPSGTKTPLKSLREMSHADPSSQSTSGGGGGRGIVIPTGTASLKWACQQISSLLSVHRTTLPIQIAHAGDQDLPPAHRAFVKSLFPQDSVGFLDVLSVFSDETLSLTRGGWAIKPFALLASPFAEVLLADADTVFVRRPEELFADSSYAGKGALLFHDRLLWKGKFAGRRAWWREQIARPGPELEKSRVWMEDYSEEGDSGVVLVDKRRVDVWVGMMHAAWQNSRDVREEITYRITYGDKETYWFGLELAESAYSFEKSYAGIAGWLGTREGPAEMTTPPPGGGGGDAKVCSFVIAHADEQGRLLWYNGSLRRNKANRKDRSYLVPTHWMINGTWEKGPRGGFSCMRDGVLAELTGDERTVLAKSVEGAERLDEAFRKWGGDGG